MHRSKGLIYKSNEKYVLKPGIQYAPLICLIRHLVVIKAAT